MELCSIECVNIACKPDSFLKENQTFLITIIASVSGCLGLTFSYFLKSRCKQIKIFWGCLSCDRTVLELPIESVNVESVA